MSAKDDVTSDLVFFGLIGVGLYLAYQWLKSSPLGAGISSAAGAVSSAASSGVNLLATPFLPGPSTMTPTGQIVFPNGSMSPVSSFSAQLAQGPASDGNVYIMQGGTTYQLSASDANGNFAATPVS